VLKLGRWRISTLRSSPNRGARCSSFANFGLVVTDLVVGVESTGCFAGRSNACPTAADRVRLSRHVGISLPDLAGAQGRDSAIFPSRLESMTASCGGAWEGRSTASPPNVFARDQRIR